MTLADVGVVIEADKAAYLTVGAIAHQWLQQGHWQHCMQLGFVFDLANFVGLCGEYSPSIRTVVF